jgi:hypothetical protein
LALNPLAAGSLPPENVWLAALVKVTDCLRRQLHTGLLYRTPTGRLYFGHLAWHTSLKLDGAPVGDGYYWVPSALLPDAQQVVANRLHNILHRNRDKIPYSIEHEGDVETVFSADGIWTDDRPGQGLTCATFVRAIFASSGLPFVNFQTWVDRPGDDAWRTNMIALMRSDNRIPPDHIDAQVARIGTTTRFRPEDVPAAIDLVRTTAVTFNEVAPVAADMSKVVLAPCT